MSFLLLIAEIYWSSLITVIIGASIITLITKGISYLVRYKKNLELKCFKEFEDKEYAKAIDLCTTYLSKYKHNVNLLIIRGLSHIELDNYKEGEEDLLSALNLEKQSTTCLLNLALLTFKYNNYTKSLDYITQAIENEPDNSTILYHRALINNHLGNYSKSLEDLDKIMQIDESNYDVILANKAFVHYCAGNYYEASNDFQRAWVINPEQKLIYKYRGIMNFTIMKFRQAIEDLEKAISLDKELKEELEPYIYEAKGKMN